MNSSASFLTYASLTAFSVTVRCNGTNHAEHCLRNLKAYILEWVADIMRLSGFCGTSVLSSNGLIDFRLFGKPHIGFQLSAVASATRDGNTIPLYTTSVQPLRGSLESMSLVVIE